MATIRDMCWAGSEELFEDVDLRRLQQGQRELLIGGTDNPYPDLLLVHTGKISIAINLECDDELWAETGPPTNDYLTYLWNFGTVCPE